MAIICTDAGHGGRKPGAIWEGNQEKDINLACTLLLNQVLLERGHQVKTTRKSDENVPPLLTRCSLINSHHREKNPKFDAIVSVHCDVAAVENKFSGELKVYPNRKGFYAIYSAESNSGRKLANTVVDHVKDKNFNLNGDGLVTTIDLGRTLAWIHRTIPTSILLELGFMTNPDDMTNLRDSSFCQRLMNSVADGIEDFVPA